MYDYFCLELTPSIFGKLVVQLFSTGEWVHRSDIVRDVCKYHLDNGGICNKREYISVFKKAIKPLVDDGVLIPRGFSSGLYRIPICNLDQDDCGSSNSDVLIIGDGSESVYLYYYNSGRVDDEKYLCKIGKTKGSVQNRVNSQCTSSIEKPVIGLIIHCDNCSILEKLIHLWLDFLGRHNDVAAGKEWYYTSVDEVKRMYSFINSMN